MADEILTVKGAAEVARNLRALVDRFPDLAAQGLNEQAELTMTDAKQNTPVEFGILKGSGKVSTFATRYKLAARLTFGTEYAVYVHERTELRHPRGGEAKFLEHAIQRAAARLPSDVAAFIAARMR